jgi:hypothetical protein
MTALERIQARKAEAEAAHKQAVETRKAAEAAEGDAYMAMTAASGEVNDAEEWLSVPKAARKRVLAAKPEDVAAFGSACSYGPDEPRWVEAKWRKGKDRWAVRDYVTDYTDTPTGTAARILHRRGREWCGSLEVANG